MFSRILTKKSTQSFSVQIERLKTALQECNAVVIGAGAGLSAAAGFTQLFNLCPKPLGVLLDALCKEQRCINIVVANGTFGKLLKYVVALSVTAEEAFSVGTLLILGKDDFTGADIHGAEDGVITDLSLFIFHSRYLRECR